MSVVRVALAEDNVLLREGVSRLAGRRGGAEPVLRAQVRGGLVYLSERDKG